MIPIRATLVAVAMLAALIAPTPASAAMTSEAFEECLLDLINADRAAHGAVALQMAYDLNPQVRAYSQKMAGEGDISHMTTSERIPILPSDWSTWGENVAWHSLPDLENCSTIHDMFMNSPPHRANILSANKRFVALGVFIGSNGTWVTQLFFNSPTYQAPAPQADGSFWDDDGHIFEGDIEKLAAAGITAGCNPPINDRFCPNDHLTRGQMAAMLVRALNLTNTNSTDFIDDDGHIFEGDIEKLAAAGITRGCNPPTNNRFCPDDHLTRGQMAAMLVRALGLTNASSTDFIDDNNSIFEADIEKLAAAGITRGCNPPTNNQYCPYSKVTRGEMAAFIVRAVDL